MNTYAILWDYKHKTCWPPEPGDLEVSAGLQLQKFKLQDRVDALYSVILVSWSKAEKEHKDGNYSIRSLRVQVTGHSTGH